MPLSTKAPGQTILAADHNEIYNLLKGTAGAGEGIECWTHDLLVDVTRWQVHPLTTLEAVRNVSLLQKSVDFIYRRGGPHRGALELSLGDVPLNRELLCVQKREGDQVEYLNPVCVLDEILDGRLGHAVAAQIVGSHLVVVVGNDPFPLLVRVRTAADSCPQHMQHLGTDLLGEHRAWERGPLIRLRLTHAAILSQEHVRHHLKILPVPNWALSLRAYED